MFRALALKYGTPADLYAIKCWTAAAAAAADDTFFKISLDISRPSLESGDNCNTVDNDCEDKLDDDVDEEDCKVHR